MERTCTSDDERFRRALDGVAARRRFAALRGFVSVVAAVLLALLALLHLLHRAAAGWEPLPLVSFALFWGGAAWAVWRAPGLLSVRSRMWLASEIDDRTGLKGLTGAALEFGQGGGRVDVYSGFLRGETIRRAGRELRGIDAGRLFCDLGRPAWGVAGLAAGAVLLVLVSVTGGGDGGVLEAISDPMIYFERRGGVNLVVTTGDRTMLAGGAVRCEAVNFGAPGGTVDLRVSSVPGVWKRIEIAPETISAGGIEVAAYRHLFDDVQEDFSYRFEYEGVRTREHRITVIHRPVINRLGAVICFPSYTGTPPETVSTLAGRMHAAIGSRVELVGETSKRVLEGRIDFARARDLPIAPVPGGFSGSFVVTGDDTFFVSIVDTAGLSNERRIRYPVVALEDGPPVIEILSPEDGAYLPLSMETRLEYEAGDDYGLSAVRLFYLREGKDEEFAARGIPLPYGAHVRDVEDSYAWSLSALGLFPGDAVLYYLEAADNNAVAGPAVGRTETRRLVVPSLGDLYESISEREALRRDGFDHIQEESCGIRRDLAKLLDEYKSRGTLDWSRRREAEGLLERHEELMQRIRGAGDELGETLEQLERNRATSQEIGEKLAEIRDLLERMGSERLLDAMERFRERLGRLSPEELAGAMKELDMDMEDLAKRLERTAELLRRIMREERLEELVRRMESMLAEQRDIRDSEESGEDLAGRQRELLERMEDLDRDLGGFEEDTGGPVPGWEEMLEGFDMDELAAEMKRAMDGLRKNDRESAKRSQGEAMDDMLSLYTALARFQFGLDMQTNAETARRLSLAARRLVEISKRQEEALDEYASAAGRAERQLVIREAIRAVRDRLYATAKETMSVSNAVFLHLGRALAESGNIIERLEQRGGGGAADGTGRICESLNMAAVELLRASSAAGSCGGGGIQGMMRSLTHGQLSIDEALRQMLGEEGGAWSEEERARMARIAAEQRRLEELLEEINRDVSETDRMLGRLDDLGEEMAEIAKRLEEGDLDEELLEREERILSRMLESQRSLSRRDYKDERRSRTAADIRAAESGAASEGRDEAAMILEMIRKGMRERGPAEYEDLIRRYFRALARKVREGKWE